MSTANEILTYAALCKREYPGSYEEAAFLEWGDGARCTQLSAELAYIQHHNAMPTWAKIIEKFHINDEGRHVYSFYQAVKPTFRLNDS